MSHTILASRQSLSTRKPHQHPNDRLDVSKRHLTWVMEFQDTAHSNFGKSYHHRQLTPQITDGKATFLASLADTVGG